MNGQRDASAVGRLYGHVDGSAKANFGVPDQPDSESMRPICSLQIFAFDGPITIRALLLRHRFSPRSSSHGIHMARDVEVALGQWACLGSPTRR